MDTVKKADKVGVRANLMDRRSDTHTSTSIRTRQKLAKCRKANLSQKLGAEPAVKRKLILGNRLVLLALYATSRDGEPHVPDYG